MTRRTKGRRLSPGKVTAIAAPMAVIVVALAGVALAALAFRMPADRAAGDPLEVVFAGDAKRGGLELKNSRRGHAILSNRQMAPGDRVRGTVWIRNRSRRPVSLILDESGLTSPVGESGERLAPRLRLRVRRMRPDGRRVYAGSLAGLADRRAGRLRPGVARRYRFTVRMRDGGTPPDEASGDNLLEDLRARVGFVWRAQGVGRR